MRLLLAKILVFTIGFLVLTLSAIFAFLQNR